MFTTPNNRIARFTLLTALAAGAAPVMYGCSADRNSAIPASAIIRAEGNGDTVSASADSHGTAYVFDATDRKLVWSGEVRGGQAVMVNARDNNVTVDGRPVHQKGIHAGHRYRIFFDPTVHV